MVDSSTLAIARPIYLAAALLTCPPSAEQAAECLDAAAVAGSSVG